MMKRIILYAAVFSFLLAACGFSADGSYPSSPGGGGSNGGSSGTGVGEGGEGGGDGGGNGNQGRPDPGQLTAGEWSDIKNYDFYLNLFNIVADPDIEGSQRRSGFGQFTDYFGFETRYMVTVNVSGGALPVGDAAVELYDAGQTMLFAAKTDVRGNACLYPPYDLDGENITVKVVSGGNESLHPFVYAREKSPSLKIYTRTNL